MSIDVDPGRFRARLVTRGAALEHVRRTMVRFGPPRRLAAEVQWFTADPSGERPSLEDIVDALGPHAPAWSPVGRASRPLASGSVVDVGPGGQIRVLGAPARSAQDLHRALASDAATVRTLLERARIDVYDTAADAVRAPELVRTGNGLVEACRAFDATGTDGTWFLTGTAATHVEIDGGSGDDSVTRRWRLLTMMGPALVAAFARSPWDGWASPRTAAWLSLGIERTDGVEHPSAYPLWVLAAPVTGVVGVDPTVEVPPDAAFGDWIDGGLDDIVGRRPALDDLDRHLATLFPPVRPVGRFRVEYLDAQSADEWRVAVSALEALTESDRTIEEAESIVAPVALRWSDAAEFGLGDVDLRAAATGLMSLAAEATTDRGFAPTLDAAATRCLRGDPPR